MVEELMLDKAKAKNCKIEVWGKLGHDLMDARLICRRLTTP
jgi:hypothetical protein